MPRADHLGWWGVIVGVLAIALFYRFPDDKWIGTCAAIVAVILVGWYFYAWFTGSGGDCRAQWLELEGKFQSVHDAVPKPIAGVPWHGGNPHPEASWDGSRWR